MEDVRLVEVKIWGQTVGAVAPLRGRPGVYEFQYAPSFAQSKIELSPLHVPLNLNRSYSFPNLRVETFYGLPGFLADALPDKFGNAVIDAFLKSQKIGSITTLQRLLYVGRRATGALEFEPAIADRNEHHVATSLQMAHLVEDARRALRGEIMQDAQDIMDVGSSAGGARAKAVIGWNPVSKEVVSGQFDLPHGFEHWLLKFDVEKDVRTLGISAGFGRTEYAYHLMALNAGLTMNPCSLFEENGRAHFMTKRFDREGNKKLHMHSLCGLAQLDFNMPYAHSYDQYFRTILNMNLGAAAIQQAWIRCAFNVASVNCDDHTKNFAFLLNDQNEWQLAPAYDVCFSHDPDQEKKTSKHQMMVNGKVANITKADLLILAANYNVKHPMETLDRIIDAVGRWPEFAKEAGVPRKEIERISSFQKIHRIETSTIPT